MSHSTQRSVALWHEDGRATFASAWRESGTDGAGRPLYRIVVYAASSPLPPAALARLLLWFYRQDLDKGPPPARLNVASENLVDDEAPLAADERDSGCAALALLEVELVPRAKYQDRPGDH